MACLYVTGGKPLSGEVMLQGSKNAVLPIMAASILCNDECLVYNCPDISDVRCALNILNELGCCAVLEKNKLTIKPGNDLKCRISPGLMKKMRSSVMFAGAMLSRCGRAEISAPGGCKIGERPIDMHIDAFLKLGAKVENDADKIIISADRLHGSDISLPFPSVGATENVMLASCLAEGETTLFNAAKEPEIADLERFLNSCGADICGSGSDVIHIKGVKELHGTVHTVIPDRIACATYLFVTAATGGEIVIKNCIPSHLDAVCEILERMNCTINKTESSINIKRYGKLKSAGAAEAGVYPLFPTDVQPLLTAAACVAEGKTVIRDNVFPDRFGYVTELKKLGADIMQAKNNEICVTGVSRLWGECICASELRGGAALVAASLAAKGNSVIDGICYIDRGYENTEKIFTRLGADIIRKQEN